MEFFSGWTLIIIGAIALFGVIKVIRLVMRSRTHTQPTRPINSLDYNQNSNSEQEVGPMIYFASKSFGLKDSEYHFTYKKVGGSWRAYILRMPSLKNRSKSGLVTHRLFDGGAYVCWDSPIHSLEEVQTVSTVWADNIQRYIATGKRFG